MTVAVEDGVGPVLRDRTSEPLAAEKRPDRLPLAFDRRSRRRVVEQHDPDRAVLDRLEPALERRDLRAGLRVEPPQERLTEVGKQRVGEPADEAFRPCDPDLDALDRADVEAALEQADTPVAKRGDELLVAIGMPVVVAEHGDDRRPDLAGDVSEHGSLLGLAVGREVTREQNDVGLPVGVGERRLEPDSLLLRAMDVTGGGDLDAHALLIAHS
jgi:hypothetical protein